MILILRRLFPNWQEDLDHYAIKCGSLLTAHCLSRRLLDAVFCSLRTVSFSTWEFGYGAISNKQIWSPHDAKAPQTLCVSRDVFETLLRRLVTKYRNNVTYITGTVDGYQADGVKLDGVKFRADDGVERFQYADFVVGASYGQPSGPLILIKGCE